VREDDQGGTDDRLDDVTSLSEHADSRRAPDGGGGVDAADVDTITQGNTCAKEADAVGLEYSISPGPVLTSVVGWDHP
jgi:hypothetical protein